MSEFHTVCKIGELAEGEGKTVAVCGKLIALFHSQGEFHAIDDMCPHMGASLAGGHVENGTVTCPWHAWRFNIKDGTWMDNKRIKIGSFPVRVDGDQVQIAVPVPTPKPGEK